MNYTALKQAIQDYTENDEESFIDNIPLFVQQTEQRVFNKVLFASLRKAVSGSMTANNRYLACPDDFLWTSSLSLVDDDGAYTALLEKDVGLIREAYPNPSDTGVPRFYTLFGTQSGDEAELTFMLGPTPDASYTAELHYYYYPESIVTAGTTWLGDNFDSVLLYGSLVEAYIFMKGEADVLQMYETKFQDSLAMAMRLGNGLERTDAMLSSRHPRIQVT